MAGLDIPTLRALVAEDPDEFLYRFSLADRLMREPDPPYEEVLEHTARALAGDPTHLVSIEIAARAHRALGDLDAALSFARRGLELARAGTDPTPITAFGDLIDDLELEQGT